MQFETVLSTLAGIAAGGVITFLTSKYYAIKSAKDVLGIRENVQQGMKQSQALSMFAMIMMIMVKLDENALRDLQKALADYAVKEGDPDAASSS